MRLTVLANGDIASNIALNLLLRALPNEITHVFLSNRVGAISGDQPAGLGELTYIEQTFFKDIFFPLIEQEAVDEKRFMSFRQLSNHHLIPITLLNEINSAEGLQTLIAARPELILSIRYGRILKYDAINVPKLGVLNLHSGLLPDYRGVLATFRALINGDPEIGSTLHYISDPGIDVGDIIACDRVRVCREKSLFWHIIQLYFSGIPMMCAAVRNLARDIPLSPTPQKADQGHYYGFPTEQDFAAFHHKGWRVADPTDIEMVTGYYR